MKIVAWTLALALGPLAQGAAQQAPAGGDAEQRVESLLAQMTLEEKIGLLGGVNLFDVPGLPRLGIPMRGTADSPFGVRAIGPSTLYAAGISLAASWNPGLAERIGSEIGRDARARGKHYQLGPGVNIYRTPLNGRNFEYYGEDPFLGSRMAVGFITGVQRHGVSATIKHYLGNNSEFARNTTDSRIDERTLREIYLPIFEAAVKEAGAGAVMSSYNLTNGEYMSANRRLAVEVLKQEWGFSGVLMSDWGGTHSALGAANGGTDLEMPGPQHLNRDSLLPLIQQGLVTPATIDDKVRRLLRNAVRFGWLDRPQLDPSIPKYSQTGRQAALQGAREGMVLLKNDGNLLPLSRPRVRSIAVIGPNAHPAVPLGSGSATIPTYNTVSFLEGLSDFLGTNAAVHHARGIPSYNTVATGTHFLTAPTGGSPGITAEVFNNPELTGPPASTRVDRAVRVGAPLDIGALASGEPVDFSLFGPPRPVGTRWTGYFTPVSAGTFDIVVHQGGFSNAGYRLYLDDQLVADRWSRMQALVEAHAVPLDQRPHKVVLEYHSAGAFGGPVVRMGIMPQGAWVDPAAVAMAASADVVVLAVGYEPQIEGEGWDRTFALPPGQNELIERIAAANRNAIVVVTAGGGVDMAPWVDRVPAVLQAWYPGQEGGTALAEILLGEVNPSGHLPVTIERRLEDNPAYANWFEQPGTNRIEYQEGVFVGYRGFERNGTQPLFAFGHGLSYTTFQYANLAVAPAASASNGSEARWEVTFDVTNTGSRAGAAVPQVYLGSQGSAVPRPVKELKGFVKVMLQPGETQRVTVPLTVRSLAYYEVNGKLWRAQAGTYDVLVGRSSADIVLSGTLRLARAATVK